MRSRISCDPRRKCRRKSTRLDPPIRFEPYGQVLAHVADGQYEFCGAAAGNHDEKGIEKSAKTKTEIVAALKAAFAYCDAIYAGMTDAKAVEMIPAFGGAKITRLTMLDFNVSHTMEHYGNLVTYMRIQGMVPPSSESQK